MNKTRVTIEVYDADGVLCESIGGKMDFEDIQATMISVLKNEGIPVLRCLGKHAAKEECHKDGKGEHCKPDDPTPCLPLYLKWEYDGIKFDAIGQYDDVMDAQAEFLRGILEE